MTRDVTDKVDIGVALRLLDDKKPPPMATCPRDDEPLISTLEFNGAEFICVVCGNLYGFLSPKPAEQTPELWERYNELKNRYEDERAERERAANA